MTLIQNARLVIHPPTEVNPACKSQAKVTGRINASSNIRKRPAASQHNLNLPAGWMIGHHDELSPSWLFWRCEMRFVFRVLVFQTASDSVSTLLVDNSIHLPCNRISLAPCFIPHDTTYLFSCPVSLLPEESFRLVRWAVTADGSQGAASWLHWSGAPFFGLLVIVEPSVSDPIAAESDSIRCCILW